MNIWRSLALPLLCGGLVALVAVGVYWGLEALLVSCTDYDRGLWEGAATVMVISAGHSIASRMLQRSQARKEGGCT